MKDHKSTCNFVPMAWFSTIGGPEPERDPGRECCIHTYLPRDFTQYHEEEYFLLTDTDKPGNLTPALQILTCSCLKASQYYQDQNSTIDFPYKSALCSVLPILV